MKAIIAAVSILVLAGCQVQGVQLVPSLDISVNQDGRVLANGGLSIQPVFTEKWKPGE